MGLVSTRSEVNARLLRTDIRGKAYIDVAQRIDGFWELYPEGALVTELLADDGNRCTFRATAYDGEGRRLATGHAFEERSGRVNTTSYVENCETSAVGRALGNLGIGSTEHVASADEVQGALEAQGPQVDEQAAKRAAYIERARALRAECIALGIAPEGVDGWARANLGTADPDVMDESTLVRYGQHLRGLAEAKEQMAERV